MTDSDPKNRSPAPCRPKVATPAPVSTPAPARLADTGAAVTACRHPLGARGPAAGGGRVCPACGHVVEGAAYSERDLPHRGDAHAGGADVFVGNSSVIPRVSGKRLNKGAANGGGSREAEVLAPLERLARFFPAAARAPATAFLTHFAAAGVPAFHKLQTNASNLAAVVLALVAARPQHIAYVPLYASINFLETSGVFLDATGYNIQRANINFLTQTSALKPAMRSSIDELLQGATAVPAGIAFGALLRFTVGGVVGGGGAAAALIADGVPEALWLAILAATRHFFGIAPLTEPQALGVVTLVLSECGWDASTIQLGSGAKFPNFRCAAARARGAARRCCHWTHRAHARAATEAPGLLLAKSTR